MTQPRCFFLFSLLFLFLGSTLSVEAQSENAVEGELNLNSINLEKTPAFPLSGEWEFFFKKFSEDINYSDQGMYLNVPGDWKEVFDFGPNFTEGYGTYRLRVKGLEPDKIIGFKVPTIHSASRVIINGERIGGFGTPGKSKGETVAQIGGEVILFKPKSKEIEILIEVSNFHFFQSGIWSPIYFGDEQQILKLDRKDRMYSFLLVGALLIMGVYHLFLAFIQRSFLESMFFGMACVFLAIRELAGPDAILLDIIPGIEHGFVVRLVYFSLGFAFMFQALFIFKLFLSHKRRLVYIVLGALMVLFALTISISDTKSASILFNYFTLFLAPPFIIYGFYIVLKGVLKKKDGAVVFLVGLLFFYSSAVHDFIWAFQETGSGSSSYWLPYGFFFLILSQSVMLSIRFNRAFINEAKLADRLMRTNQSLRRFIPKEFLKLLGKEDIIDVNLGDSISKDMTVLFADVRNFTSLSEGLTSKETFEFINRLLLRTDPIIRRNNGFIDKYIGDAVMALFEDLPDHALQAALELQEEVRSSNSFENQKIGVGIGIHFGNLILGTVGSEHRMDGTVISDAVNTASRIEELTKAYQVSIIISDDCKMMLENPENFGFRLIDEVNLRGRKASTKLYEVFPKSQPYPNGFVECFEEAVMNFREVKVSEAKDQFEKCLAMVEGDGPCLHFLQKIEDYMKVHKNLK